MAEDSSILTAAVLPAALAVIMVTLGLSLRPADFRRIVVFPRGIAIGLANLTIISPLLAFAVATAFDLSPELAVGLVLLGASPGGTMANMLTHLARGDTALAVTMTATSSVAAMVTVPLFLGLAIDHFDATGLGEDVEMLGVVARVFAITILPLALGMWIRSRNPERVEEIYPRMRRIALVAFVAVVVGAVIAEREKIDENVADVAGAALALNVAAIAVSFTIARLSRLDDRQATAIAIELGVHNAALAIAVGATVTTVLTIPAAVYSAFMFITAGLFARVMYRRNAPAPLM
jgi:bile acid:Na+ symporter, BASS family